MKPKPAETAPRDQWVLIRRARQLITLRGPSGPRRGAAMSDIGVLADGAVLIHNGAIVETGPSRRIENLQQARTAREIDALGKVVMPAFVDPDAVLVSAPSGRVSASPDLPLGVFSKKRLEAAASTAAAAWARSGVLTVGAHTGQAADVREAVKALQIHHGLQNKPLRIRSILSPRRSSDVDELTEKWIPAGRKRKLASILELTAGESGDLRRVAIAGASAGYSFRLRSNAALDDEGHELAIEGGAVAIVAPPPGRAEGPGGGYVRKLAAIGCVHVLPAGYALDQDRDFTASGRPLIEDGAAVAVASGYASAGYSSFNPQFLLYLAAARFRMRPEEAICATTWNAACSLRMSHVTGSVEPGKSADIVIMDAGDYRELPRRAGHNDVQIVMRSGQIVYRRASLAGID